MKFFILLAILSMNAWAQQETTQPLGTSGQKIKFLWESSDDKTAKKVKELEVSGKKIKVENGEWLNNDDEVEIDEIDLNYDKKNDYAITVRRGISNRYALYLLWDEAETTFISLGVQPELSPIDKKQCWSGFEKGKDGKAVQLKVEGQKFVKCPK